MKKFVALVLVALLSLGTVAFAEGTNDAKYEKLIGFIEAGDAISALEELSALLRNATGAVDAIDFATSSLEEILHLGRWTLIGDDSIYVEFNAEGHSGSICNGQSVMSLTWKVEGTKVILCIEGFGDENIEMTYEYTDNTPALFLEGIPFQLNK